MANNRDVKGKYVVSKLDLLKRHGYAIFRAFLVSVVCIAVVYLLEALTPFNVGLQAYLAAAVAGNLGSLIGQYQDHPKNAYRFLVKTLGK